jgi:hypothetical protein
MLLEVKTLILTYYYYFKGGHIMSNKEKVLSFNKRISLVKSEVFTNVTKSKELENIKGTNTVGFYSLSIIEKHLFPALVKYDLDLDLEILPCEIIGKWIDCIDEKVREIKIDFSRIENVEKLQLMANVVQSEGAVKSYTRRYALTSILRLPSTDLIDTDILQNNQNNNQTKYVKKEEKKQYNTTTNGKDVTVTKTQNVASKVTQAQLKRYYGIAKSKGFNVDWLDECICMMYDLITKKDWLKGDYSTFTDYIDSHTKEETINIITKKLTKLKKTMPPVPAPKEDVKNEVTKVTNDKELEKSIPNNPPLDQDFDDLPL